MKRSLTMVGVGSAALLSLLGHLVASLRMSPIAVVLTSVVIAIGLHGAWACVVSYVVGTEFHTEE